MTIASSRAWLAGALAGLAAVAMVDVATGDDAFARSLYLLPVLAAATRARRAPAGRRIATRRSARTR